MRKSKLIAFVVSLGMVFSSIASLNVKAAVGDTLPLPAGHVFVDIAHNGNTIVAMSKPAPKYDSAILWCSEDAGKTWKNVREIKSALISSVPKSQQQLVYW